MKHIFLIFNIFYLFFLNTLYAEDNRSKFYVGTSINFDFLKNQNISENATFGGEMNIGYDFNSYFSLEVREGTGFTTKSSLLLDNSISFYSKGRYSLYEDIDAYLLLGLSKTEISSGVGDIDSQSAFSYGLGLDYKLSTSISLFTDYSKISSGVSQINFGLRYYYNNHGLDGKDENDSDILSYKEKKEEDKRVESLRIKEKLEEKRKREAEAKKKKEAEEKLKMPTIVKINLLHKEDTLKPILIYFFEVKSIDEFKRMDYEELISNEKEMLGGSIINRSKDILKPGKMKTVEFNIKYDSKYYVVVSAINDVKSTDDWRYIRKLNAHEINTIDLMLDHKKIMEFSKWKK